MDEQPASGARKLKQQSNDIRKSAKVFEKSAGHLTDNSERRTVLAADRTLLAAERTYAAWVRTAIAALAAGIGARTLVKDMLPLWVGKLTGTVLVVFAGFCLIAAVWREIHDIPAPPDLRRIPVALLVPINALLLLVAIAALVGIWAA